MGERSDWQARGGSRWSSSPHPLDRHRRRLHTLVAEVLGGGEAALVVSSSVLARAEAQWSARPPRRPPSDLVVWQWLRSLAVEGCAWAAEEGVDAVADALERMEAGASPLTRAVARDRARWRSAFEARMRDLGALGAIPWRWARQQWRRFEETATSMAPATQRVGVFGSAAGLSPAALAATATLALGAVIPHGPEVPTRAPVEMAAEVERARAVTPEPMVPPATGLITSPVTPTPVSSSTTSPEPAPTPVSPAGVVEEERSGSEPEPPAPMLPGTPRVTASPTESVAEPVRDEPWEGGRRYYTPNERVGVDADGDGEDDVWTETPPFFLHCSHDPADKGPASDTTCAVLEESGLPSEPTG